MAKVARQTSMLARGGVDDVEQATADCHKDLSRYGYPVSNFLASTPIPKADEGILSFCFSRR